MIVILRCNSQNDSKCWYMTAQYKKVEEKEIKNVKLKVIQI